ncbi:MAG: class I SAM-dependent methyltransferase [Steroidobacteraceae bacterium]|jgi:ubiquinone/menaquinone biosynthesis C-methylase UbiE|nr:class I SAM-dependent methyltransferase [Gammaproteobacteria bacterium]
MMSPFQQHSMLPDTVHDEQARQDFVAAFRGHLSGQLMPGTYQVYSKRVEPRFTREKGRVPADEHEVRALMTQDSFYQFWSAMQRRSQELLWEAVIDPVERELPSLIERAKRPPKRGQSAGSLRLNPDLVVPRYHTAADIHLQPGGYHSDFTRDDVAAGAVYDKGINLYMGGALGPQNNLMGDTLLAYLREYHPTFKPKRILDMGCAIGNSTVVWAKAFPDVEVHGIDVGAPVLRYAHGRAQALGAKVHFSQQNAEATDFESGSFDLVLSHIVLHETSKSALVRILAECRRLLRPGGLMLHLEIPRGRTAMEKFMHNWESYNNNETFSRYMTDLDLAAESRKAGFQSNEVTVSEFAPKLNVSQMNYAEHFFWKILAGTNLSQLKLNRESRSKSKSAKRANSRRRNKSS